MMRKRNPRLAAALAERGIKWGELADKSGISRAELYNLSTGARRAFPATVKALADVLGVAPEALGIELYTGEVRP